MPVNGTWHDIFATLIRVYVKLCFWCLIVVSCHQLVITFLYVVACSFYVCSMESSLCLMHDCIFLLLYMCLQAVRYGDHTVAGLVPSQILEERYCHTHMHTTAAVREYCIEDNFLLGSIFMYFSNQINLWGEKSLKLVITHEHLVATPLFNFGW